MKTIQRISDEGPITLGQAAEIIGSMTRRPLNPCTLSRWTQFGIRGVRLESALIGGQRFTSRAAIERFLGRINGDKESKEVVA